jgi:hypothetical protein
MAAIQQIPVPTPPGAQRRNAQLAVALRPPLLGAWVRMQSINAARHAAALRPFGKNEFGEGPASPSDAHIEAANDMIEGLRRGLIDMSRRLTNAAAGSQDNLTPEHTTPLLRLKDTILSRVRLTEDIWKFYLELFGQRQSRFGPQLLACDRIALDCYQYVYTGLGRIKPIPAPAPFCYMETGFSPATFRRGVRISKLGKKLNPFPLIQLPYHRLVNPWTLGAVLHESAHNLQSDLGLWQVVPLAIAKRLLAAGLPYPVVRVWARWHKETWADLCAVLLGGPEIVASLMDIVGRSPESTFAFHPADVHPTPYFRLLINTELLLRIGFTEAAEAFRKAWARLYPNPAGGSIPKAMLATFQLACRLVVDTIAFTKYEQLGGKSLAEAVKFESKDQAMVEQAGKRLAASRDPGIVPALFLVGAARFALDRSLARPEIISRNFYRALVRR